MLHPSLFPLPSSSRVEIRTSRVSQISSSGHRHRVTIVNHNNYKKSELLLLCQDVERASEQVKKRGIGLQGGEEGAGLR